MGILIREVDGKETTWFSKEYVQRQKDMSFQEGVVQGAKIEFHALEPGDEDAMKQRIADFRGEVIKSYK